MMLVPFTDLEQMPPVPRGYRTILSGATIHLVPVVRRRQHRAVCGTIRRPGDRPRYRCLACWEAVR